MIKRIDKLDPRDLPALNTHCMRTIWSHFSAYGTEYDFCEFYRLWRQRTQIGYICSFNGSITAQLVYGKRATSDIIRELSEFVNLKDLILCSFPKACAQRRAFRAISV